MSAPSSVREPVAAKRPPLRTNSAQPAAPQAGSAPAALATQRSAGNQAAGQMLQAPDNGARYALKLKIGAFEWSRSNQSAAEALVSLRQASKRLYSEISVGLAGQNDLGRLRADQPLTALVSQTLGRVSFPDVNIWDPGFEALDQADQELRAGHINESIDRLQVAAKQISAAKQKLTDYREGSISGAGRAEVALEVIQTAAAVTVSVGTGGLAGVAIGTAYGTAQSIARQGSEVSLGLRKEIDWGSIAFETLFGLATGMLGGQVGNKVLKALLKNPTTATLGRKVLSRIVSDLVSGRLSSLLMTAGRQVFEQARGRQKMTVESFIDAMVANVFDPKQALLDVLMGEAQRRGASAVTKKRAADVQAKALKQQKEAPPPTRESTAAKQEVAAPKNESAPAKLEPAGDVDVAAPKTQTAGDADVAAPKMEPALQQENIAPQKEPVAPPKQAAPAADAAPAPKETAAAPAKETLPAADAAPAPAQKAAPLAETDFSGLIESTPQKKGARKPVGKKLGGLDAAINPQPQPVRKPKSPQALKAEQKLVSKMHAERRAKGTAKLDPDLQKLAEHSTKNKKETFGDGKTTMQDVAADSPERLNQLWRRWKERKPQGKIRSKTFAEYLSRVRRGERGGAGENTLAFATGPNETMLKAPKGNPFAPGSDMLTYRKDADRIKYYDNKAYGKGAKVDAVSALERNLLKNMKKDIADLAHDAKAGSTPSVVVKTVLPRMRAALADLNAYASKLNSDPKIRARQLDSAKHQKAMNAILAKHGIDRIVTTEAGAPDVSITSDLAGKGFTKE
jgi:hypothetical protein